MAYRPHAGRKIVRTTLTRDDWVASVTLACSDRIAVGASSPLFVEVAYRHEPAPGADSGHPVDLTFRSLAAGGGEIRFDAADGPTTRRFVRHVRTVLTLVGVTATAGAEAGVAIDIAIDGTVKESVPLFVGAPLGTLAIRAADGTADAPAEVTLGQTLPLRAVPDPAAQGTYRWIVVTEDSLAAHGATDAAAVVLGVTGGAALPRTVGCLFSPPDDGPQVFTVRAFGVRATLLVRTRLVGTAPAPLDDAWVYVRDGGTTVVLHTDRRGRARSAPTGSERAASWLYTEPFGATAGHPVEIAFSRGRKPIPDTLVQAELAFRRLDVAAETADGDLVGAVTIPETPLALTRPGELTIWPLLRELPVDASLTAGLNQGAALYDAHGNLTEPEGTVAAPPPARPRERGLVVAGTVDAGATGARVRLMRDDGTALPLHAGFAAAASVLELPATMGAPAGATRPFSALIVLDDAAAAFGPVLIVVDTVGIAPPRVDAFAVQLCGVQLALVDDAVAAADGTHAGPVPGEPDELNTIDFGLSPQDNRNDLTLQARARRMVNYDIRTGTRAFDETAAVGPGNPNVPKPQMPLWMGECQLVGIGWADLQSLMRHRVAWVSRAPAWSTLELNLSWRIELRWDGPDVNSPTFAGPPELILRSGQTYQYSLALGGDAALRVPFDAQGRPLDATGAPQALDHGAVPAPFTAAPARIAYPVAARRLPRLVVQGEQRAWGRQAGAPRRDSVIVEFQPRVEAGGSEAIRGGDGDLALQSLQIDGAAAPPGLEPDGGGAPVAPADVRPARVPTFRVRGTNPAAHAAVEQLIDALVRQYHDAHAAEARIATLPLAVWQETVRLILAHENGNDRQFFDNASGRYAFASRGTTFYYGHEHRMPLFGPPHGYGFGQLDFVFGRAANDDEVWSFVENIQSAVRVVMEEKAAAAYHDMHGHFAAPVSRRDRAAYRREVVRRYNGGTEFHWNGADWEIQPGLAQWANAHDHTQGPNQRLRYPRPRARHPRRLLQPVSGRRGGGDDVSVADRVRGRPVRPGDLRAARRVGDQRMWMSRPPLMLMFVLPCCTTLPLPLTLIATCSASRARAGSAASACSMAERMRGSSSSSVRVSALAPAAPRMRSQSTPSTCAPASPTRSASSSRTRSAGRRANVSRSGASAAAISAIPMSHPSLGPCGAGSVQRRASARTASRHRPRIDERAHERADHHHDEAREEQRAAHRDTRREAVGRIAVWQGEQRVAEDREPRQHEQDTHGHDRDVEPRGWRVGLVERGADRLRERLRARPLVVEVADADAAPAADVDVVAADLHLVVVAAHGDQRPEPIDVRVAAAARRDPVEERGEFRVDTVCHGSIPFPGSRGSS